MHRILLIEDDDLLREGLKQILEEDGCRVSAAPDGAAGMELLRDGKLAPCLILLDLMMPRMNGWDFLQLHGRHPALSKIPIAVASEGNAPRSAASGARVRTACAGRFRGVSLFPRRGRCGGGVVRESQPHQRI